jgi:hypothetical protein
MKDDPIQRPLSPSQSSSWQRADRVSQMVSGHPVEQLPLSTLVKLYQEWRSMMSPSEMAFLPLPILKF